MESKEVDVVGTREIFETVGKENRVEARAAV